MLPLKVDEVVKHYPKTQALKGLSFDVRPGEIFGLLGPNGAGKTTLISCITTLEQLTSGKIEVFGEDVSRKPLYTKKQIGIVHQEVINSGFFTVAEILGFISGYYGIKNNKNRIEYLLHKLSLFEHKDKLVKQLSGGMKRRLMIAKALVHEPRLLLLDEPTAGVDIELRRNLWDFVRELQGEGMSILLTTHYLEEAEELCHRVGIINRGKLECVGDTQEIVRRFTQRKVQITLTEEKSLTSPYLAQQNGRDYTFILPPDCQLGDLMSQLDLPTKLIANIAIDSGNLEEAFVRVLREGGRA